MSGTGQAASGTGDGLALCLAGAAGDTGNLGVQALHRAVLHGLERVPKVGRVSVLDNGWGVRSQVDGDRHFLLEYCGARHSRRWHRSESWRNITISGRLGGLANPVAKRLRAADAVLDISGGDSFSDIYGSWRFAAAIAPKRCALALGRPLVLLPQTYGPFSAPGARDEARSVVRRATTAWSRDQHSHDVLLDLLGAAADPARHRLGVDVAFALRSVEPLIEPGLAEDLTAPAERPRIGINVSGLVYNDPAAGHRLGLLMNYRAVIHRLVDMFVALDCDVFLVPHVVARQARGINVYDDDVKACRDVLSRLDPADAARVRIVPALDSSEVKWVISRMDWFCGTRMHSTIAALSSGVPTVALAYSMKTLGVFETCDQGGEVVEARTTGDDECLARVRDAWERRDAVGPALRKAVAPVRRQAVEQVADALHLVEAETGVT